MNQAVHPRAQFLRMQDSTQADWQTIGGEFMQFASQLPARVRACPNFCVNGSDFN